MHAFLSRPLALGALGLLLLAGCDSTSDALDDTADAEVAATVASAFSLDTGGALDEAAHAALGVDYADLRGPGHGGHGFARERGGACDADVSYDEATGISTVEQTCARENAAGTRAASSARTATFAYTDADGNAVRRPADASDLTFTLVSGTRLATGPRSTREVTSSSGGYTVADLDGDTVTVNGSSTRSGTYALTRPDGTTRTSDYTIALTLTDVTGPTTRRVERTRFRTRWAQAASGTADGVYTATVTTTAADGSTTTRNVERTFTIEFPVERDGRARIRMGGQTHSADAESGDVG